MRSNGKAVNNNLNKKLNKKSLGIGYEGYIANAFNTMNTDINAQFVYFSAGGPLCFGVAQKFLADNRYYCSIIFFNYTGVLGFANSSFKTDSECTINDVVGFFIS